MSVATSPRTRSETISYMPPEHVPVLATPLVDLLDPQPGETAIDMTFGGGGHARLVAERLGPDGELICIDRDPVAEERFRAFAAEAPCRTRFIRANFAEGLKALGAENPCADMVYVDLGMSSLQLDAWERGFSYSYDAPLDMRMDSTQKLTAATVLNEWPQSRIEQTIRHYGEERYSGSIAREIVARRPLRTTSELAAAINAAIPAKARFAGGHPAKRTFQAIRIAVNGELESIDTALPLAWELLVSGGRMAAIAFHSLEDRRVKQFFSNKAKGCICPPELPICACGREPEAELLTRRAVAPDAFEAESNPRARSAHLRVARKLRCEAVA